LIWDSADPGLEPTRVEEKTGEEKTGVTQLIRQEPVKNLVATH
jgi:hypothetical protein